MVLVKDSLSLSIFIVIFLLSACSSHSIKPVPVSKPVIIPVQNAPAEQANTPKGAITEAVKEINKLTTTPKKASKLELRTPSPNFTIIDVLIGKAQKAIKLQQWLRAQRSLEQAIHISPSQAQVFFLYGTVYEGLGIPEQAEQMYRRAIFLAGEASSIALQAQENLTKLPLPEKTQ